MLNRSAALPSPPATNNRLRTYYCTRAAVSVGWIGLALTAGANNPVAATVLLVAYPAWDAVANYLDAQQTGGLRSNFSQALNLVVSLITAIAVAATSAISMNAVFVVFGLWATLSGLFQLTTAVRRWRSAGAQWLMVLSGAQSALAGVFFILMARASAAPEITALLGYVGFGAFYFLASAIWLSVKLARQPSAVQN